MSNLKSARQSIEAEIRHAEQGIAYYQSKVDALRAVLEQLQSAEGETAAPASRSRKASAGTVKRGRKPKSRAAGKRSTSGVRGSSLPRMTRDFWLGFIGQEPRSAIEIINAAIASFDPALNADQSKKVKQRATQALQALLTSKQIKDVGSGRQRRYFLPLGKSSGNGKQAAKGRASPATDSSGTTLH